MCNFENCSLGICLASLVSDYSVSLVSLNGSNELHVVDFLLKKLNKKGLFWGFALSMHEFGSESVKVVLSLQESWAQTGKVVEEVVAVLLRFNLVDVFEPQVGELGALLRVSSVVEGSGDGHHLALRHLAAHNLIEELHLLRGERN